MKIVGIMEWYIGLLCDERLAGLPFVASIIGGIIAIYAISTPVNDWWALAGVPGGFFVLCLAIGAADYLLSYLRKKTQPNQ